MDWLASVQGVLSLLGVVITMLGSVVMLSWNASERFGHIDLQLAVMNSRLDATQRRSDERDASQDASINAQGQQLQVLGRTAASAEARLVNIEASNNRIVSMIESLLSRR